MREERIARYYYIGTRNHCSRKQGREVSEKLVKLLMVITIQNRKTRQGSTPMAIERWRYTPHAALTVSKLSLLFFGVFD